MSKGAAELAAGWFRAWGEFDMEWLSEHLASDFVHVSPFGRFEDRDTYLAAVEPLARKSVSELVIRETLVSGDVAAVRFENRTPKGAVDTVDWIRVADGRIQEIRSFYDTSKVREVLSADEQDSLDGSY